MTSLLPVLWVVLALVDLLGNRGYRPERVGRWPADQRADALAMLRRRRSPLVPALTGAWCAAGAVASAVGGVPRSRVWAAAAAAQIVSALARRRTLSRLGVVHTTRWARVLRRRPGALVGAATIAMLLAQVAAGRGGLGAQAVAAGGGFTGVLLALVAGWPHVWLPIGGASSLVEPWPRAGAAGAPPSDPPSALPSNPAPAPHIATAAADELDIPMPFTTRKSRRRAARPPAAQQPDDGTGPGT